ncbi:hypothetical protein SALBM311S_03355 [Streptomyces alboniger]
MFRPTHEPQSKRHVRTSYFVVGEGILADSGEEGPAQPSTASTVAALRKFQFSRLGQRAKPTELLDRPAREELAQAMTRAGSQPDSNNPAVPAGFTYLGQFVDHDLTLDATAVRLEDEVTVRELLQGRSPALDLDSLYGLGPDHRFDRRFYEDDGLRLRTGTTQGLPDPGGDHLVGLPLGGFDLPRVGQGSRISERRRPLIPDGRNDENLVVAQIHSAFIRFHNRVVADLVGKGVSSAVLFETARETVVKHYQWMLRHDFLPRIVDPGVVDEVFTKGRRFFEPALGEHERPTMPVEFSVAAYRLGHSMVRGAYNWNRIFDKGAGTLPLLFRFTGTSGILSPPPADAGDPEAGTFERLPPTGSPTSDACSTSARRAATTWGSLRRSSTSPSGSTPSWSIRWPICRSARRRTRSAGSRPDRAEPGLPQPHPGEHVSLATCVTACTSRRSSRRRRASCRC